MLISMNAFKELYWPCGEAVRWVERNNFVSMRDVWEHAPDKWLIWIATRDGVLADTEREQLGCWSVRLVWDQLCPSSRHGVESRERYWSDQISEEELQEAIRNSWGCVGSKCDLSSYVCWAASLAAEGKAGEAIAWMVEGCQTSADRDHLRFQIAGWIRARGNPFS